MSAPAGPVGNPAATQPTSGPYPVTTTGPPATAHKLAAKAVALLRAETAGAGRQNYPHLQDAGPPCCRDFQPRGVAVLFTDQAETGPASVVVDWTARARRDEALRDGTTTVRMYPAAAGWQLSAKSGRRQYEG